MFCLTFIFFHCFFFFFFNDTATTEIYTLSLHDALPNRPSFGNPGVGTSCGRTSSTGRWGRSEEHTSELQARLPLVCRLLLEKKKTRVRGRSDLEIDYSTSRRLAIRRIVEVGRLALFRRHSRRHDPGNAPGSFFFNDASTTEIYTLSLHDALPI